MNRSFQSLAGTLVLATSLGLAQSSIAATTINFDNFADQQNINGVDLGGVTVTNPSGVVEIYANNRFGVSNSSPGNAIGSFTGASSINPMIFTFSAPTSFVTLFGGDGGGDTDSWTLTVYDAQVGGNMLGTISTGDFNGSPYLGLTLSAASILRAEANWTGQAAGVGYDDLSFTQVPLPAPALLLGAGLTGLIGMARRRKAG
ncbi:MAG: hypothetical protein WCS09_15265 [Pseudomonadota bacterium]